MTKNRRSLSVIATEIHGLRGQSLFQIGDLLSEAKDSCEFGEWREWLDDEFEWSHDTADRYIAVAKLGAKCRKLRQMKLPKTTLYRLAELPDEEQPAIIAELAKCAGKHLSASAAEDVITIARLRNQHGDLPDATLLALDRLRGQRVWHDKAIAELKRKKPTTEEEVGDVIVGIQLAHVTELFAPHGELPGIPTDALRYLEDVPEQNRAQVLQRLRDAEQPLTEGRIRAIIWLPQDDETDDDDDEDEDDEDDESEDDVVPPPAPMEPELLGALKTVLQYARRPMPKATGGISAAELTAIEQFVSKLHESMQSVDAVKLACDRAEARRLRHTPGA